MLGQGSGTCTAIQVHKIEQQQYVGTGCTAPMMEIDIQEKRHAAPPPSDTCNMPVHDRRSPLPEFPTPFSQAWSAFGSDSEAYTVLELELMALMGAIKEKPEWVCKVHDSCIISKWRDEAGVSDELFNRAIQELQGVASTVKNNVRPSPVDGVFESDSAVSDAVRMELVQRVLPLENLSDELLDWNPGSDQQVNDSMICELCLDHRHPALNHSPFFV